MIVIREYNDSRDTNALRDCFAELQNNERQFDPGKPEGSTIAAAYLDRMFARCHDWDGRVFVAEVTGQVVGFVCVWAKVPPEEPDESPAEYAFVSDLVVSKLYRRRGIGKQLLSAVESFARSRGSCSIRIEVSSHNVSARSRYNSLGFEEYKIELLKRLY
jgi:ribosomal protein S18 acetylase RimI-like enzyme